MAGDWMRLKTGLDSDPSVFRLSIAFNIEVDVVIAKLYRLASWFRLQGKEGKINSHFCSRKTIDSFLKIDGFAEQLIVCGLLKYESGAFMLCKFCDVSSIRKSISASTRRALLDGGCCVACGSREDLVIDHKIPVSRGGSSELVNLQPLCFKCNSSKGKKTMEEFNRDCRP